MLLTRQPSLSTSCRIHPATRCMEDYHSEILQKPPLPQNLQKLMDDSPQGVIYFSMGSTIQSKDMSVHIKRGLLDVFGKLNETVIWKMEETMLDLPSNVHLLSWAPQTSLLAHHNMKIFITHGGQLSIMEAVHFNIPMITIPRYVDQVTNTEAIVRKGVALQLDYNDDLPNNLEEALHDMLTNSRYREAMTKLSEAYHERTRTASEESTRWMDNVSRNLGGPRYSSPLLSAPWYEKIFLELMAVTISFVLVILILIKCLWWGCNKSSACHC